MSLTGWRIVKAKRAAMAFDGEGSRRFGGRFNSPGVAVVYVASALSLAILELLVHIDRKENLERYVAIPVAFDERISLRIALDVLGPGWRSASSMMPAQKVGDAWVSEAASAVLQVPSVLLPESLFASEHNYLLNPGHADFTQIEVSDPIPLFVDDRLRS